MPLKPQAPRNVVAKPKDDNQEVSQILNDEKVCQFYSIISPSVQYNRVQQQDRLAIVYDPSDLIQKCEQLHARIQNKEQPPCSSIEIAGHSTQSVGLDGIFGIDYSSGKKVSFPDTNYLGKLGKCFKKISAPKAKIIFSTCGGEADSQDRYHYWPKKSVAQQELANLFQMPVISGIGPVHFAEKYGANGSESVGGWTQNFPKTMNKK